jgi:hypothetical protein
VQTGGMFLSVSSLRVPRYELELDMFLKPHTTGESAPLSGAEEPTARTISAYAQYA